MVNIPEKMYYPIKEASELIGVEPHVLRFWETEFSELRPKKSKNGRRSYQLKDLEQALEIKNLLYDEKYTIRGAKRILQEKKENRRQIQNDPTSSNLLENIKNALLHLKSEISSDKVKFGE